MTKTKRNVIIIISALLILTAVAIGLSYQKETVEFEEFSVEVPAGYSFEKEILDENEISIKEKYRCYDEDLTITSFDKNLVEKAYFKDTGEHLDLYESFMNDTVDKNRDNVTEISENLTQIIQTANINGYMDTDVACIYHDDNHMIIVEGGDVDFITEIAKSIKIK